MNPSSSSIRRAAWLATALGVAAGGLVSAQPAPQTPPAAATPSAPPLVTPPPTLEVPPPEEAPPAEVSAPPPVSAPPIAAAEVAPAAPPKAQVVEKPEETKLKRTRSDVAILQALDKVTADSMRFEAEVGKPVRYKNLIFTVKACERAAPDEPMDDSIVYLTVDSQPITAPGKPNPPARQAFKGWMYASSPGLNPFEHPVYDAWLITCKATAPAVAPVPAKVAPPRPKPPARTAPPKPPVAEPSPAPAPETPATTPSKT